MSTVTDRPPAQMPLATSEPPPSSKDPTWWRKVLTTVAMCVAVLMMGGAVFNALASLKQEPPRTDNAGITKTYSVTVYRVEPVDLQRIITAFGTAVADREVVVSAEVAGQVVEAHKLEVGRSVKASGTMKAADGTSIAGDGDLLVRIDPKTYEEKVLQARKLLAQDDVDLQRLAQEHDNNKRLLETEKANAKTAKSEFDNAVDLRRRGVGTESAVRRAELDLRRYEDAVTRLQNELDLYEVRRKAILARIDAHQSDVELAQLDLNRTHVRPPFPGVLSEVFVEQGQYVRPGEPLVRLTDPWRVEVPLSLTLSDYLEIASLRAAGQRVNVDLAETETADSLWFSDPLDDLRQSPEADERTRTVKVYTEVDNSQQLVPLLPGTFVHARIPGPVLTGAVVIPRDAVVEGTVFVAIPESAGDGEDSPSSWFALVKRRSITPGQTLQSLVLVEQGLSAGEWVVTTNLDVIFDGARLKIERIEGERSLADELADLRTPQVEIVGDAANAH